MAYYDFKPVRTLFQYCSVEAFTGIVTSKELWFSDLASANDPREFRLGYDNIFRTLELARDRTKRSKIENLIAILEQRLVPYVKNSNVYCSCLSLARDELPMWGAYGDQYTGLAIGFRAVAIDDMPVRVQKVQYISPDSDDELVSMLIGLAERLDLRDGGLVDTLDAVSTAFAQMVAIKHATWAYEREIRLTHAQRKQPQSGENMLFSVTGVRADNSILRWTKPRERFVGPRTVQFLSFPYGKCIGGGIFDTRNAIETVIIGPKCALAPGDVNGLMSAQGFREFTVVQSDCQIR